jgi:hypothetical protein
LFAVLAEMPSPSVYYNIEENGGRENDISNVAVGK